MLPIRSIQGGMGREKRSESEKCEKRRFQKVGEIRGEKENEVF
jgi:hypothetical protein